MLSFGNGMIKPLLANTDLCWFEKEEESKHMNGLTLMEVLVMKD